MALLQVKSDNPKFSFVISKHPNLKLTATKQGKGAMYGFYTKDSDQEFNVYFRDDDDEVTYRTEKEADIDSPFEYMNLSRYNSSIFPIQAIDEFFSSTVKKPSDDDIEIHNEVIVNMVHLPKTNYVDIFNSYFKRFNLEIVEELASKNYTLKFSGEAVTLCELLKYTKLFFLFNLTINGEYYYKQESLIEKYVDLINELDAPYFLRYLFKFRFLGSKNLFKKLKEKLSQSKRYESVKLVYGDSHLARIEDNINRFDYDTKRFIDVGCGEGRYLFKIKRKHKDLEYHAIDINKELVEVLEKKCAKRKHDNVHFHTSLEQCSIALNSDNTTPIIPFYGEDEVLLTEVIEHMDEDSALSLIMRILTRLNPKRLVITTPNEGFNKHFADIDMFRHDDHEFEWDYDTFKIKIQKVVDSYNKMLEFQGLGYLQYTANYYGIGDAVNGEHTTSGVQIDLVNDLDNFKN